jgi:hypothetical protein
MNRPSINRDYQHNSSRLAVRLWTLTCALLAPTIAISPVTAEETSDPQLLPWYQVEVVIFTQQGYTGSEQPPREYRLDFPENILQLLDTDYIGNNYPVVDVDAPEPQRIIPVVEIEDPALTFAANAFDFTVGKPADAEPLLTPLLPPSKNNEVNSQTSLTQADAEAQTPEMEPAEEQEQIYIPQYEKPFIKLDRELRDLNDSARALDRRAKYNVVFHEAWRFAADKNSADPWVLIKAGKQYQDRFEIEGSLRFYKSRFLHFQSDLWLASFAENQSQSATWIEPPAFPYIPEPSLSDGQTNLQSLDVAINEAELENFFIGTLGMERVALNSAAKDSAALDKTEQQPQEPAPLQPSSYPVSSLWVFDQSKRLEEQQSYYLDHPKMGILVTIKSHQVVITNPPQQEQDIDAQATSN